jgi:hypothetical protein
MKIKVIRRPAKGPYPEGEEPEVYDIYHDVGLFSPLKKKWLIGKSALTRKEALAYLETYILDLSCRVIIDC